ncbi:MAG TPA: glycosyltransferase family 9 protein [Chloroflexota bacterium]|nr:glycosyltransferase family 9 protein [Chloroflexota bacterium]
MVSASQPESADTGPHFEERAERPQAGERDGINLSSLRRIAVFRALHLGDMLVAVPALRALRRALPRAEIVFVGLPWAREFLARFHYVDRFLDFPGCPGIRETAYSPARTERFLSIATKLRIDLAIQMHGNGAASNRFVASLGARATLGYAIDPDRSVLSLPLAYPGDNVPEVQKPLRLLERAGIPPQGTHLEFPVLRDDIDELDRLAEDRGLDWDEFWIGIHPGASAASRRWPLERYARLADRLVTDLEARVVLFGGPGEGELAAQIPRWIRPSVLDLSGQTSLGVLAAAIHRLRGFISNDSGPAHLAEAVGCPTVTIFGPGNVARWGPRDPGRRRVVVAPVPCAPCEHRECPIDHRCMTGLSVDAVFDAAARVVRGQQGPA